MTNKAAILTQFDHVNQFSTGTYDMRVMVCDVSQASSMRKMKFAPPATTRVTTSDCEPEHEPEQAEHKERHIPESPEDQKDQESGDNPCGQVTSAEPPCLQIMTERKDPELCQMVPSESDTGDEKSDHDPHDCLHDRARSERLPGPLLVLGGDNGSVLAVEVGH